MDDGLLRRVERLEAENALARFVYDYCHGLDRRDMDRYLKNMASFPGDPSPAVNFVADINRDTATGLSSLTGIDWSTLGV